MNIKKYRAATTREALEQIKMDLGEDALVMETKQVRRGGFLGLGSQMQVEISAAVTASNDEKPFVKQQVKPIAKTNRQINALNLTDDTLAVPQTYDDRKRLLNDLKMRRTTGGKNFSATTSAATAPKVLGTVPPRRILPPIEAVEINPSAPRIVHKKNEAETVIKEPVVKESVVVETKENKTVEKTSLQISNREFELLRAELREVKFSLGSLAPRQNVHFGQNIPNVDEFGEVLDSPFFESYMELASRGISTETARQMIFNIIPQYKKGLIKPDRITREALLQAVSGVIKFADNPLESGDRIILALIGATGVGKTTTIAKLAAWMGLRERRRVELITLDTYRIAAVEQLKTYAEIIGAGCHIARSVFEVEAILKRLPEDANVFIDTTGKNPHDLADQYEVSEYLAQHKEIRKCLAVQATTNPIDAAAAIKKFEMYGADCMALTKMDETLRPGSPLELVAESPLPLVYFSTGQRVPEDLQVATPERFVSRILGQ